MKSEKSPGKCSVQASRWWLSLLQGWVREPGAEGGGALVSGEGPTSIASLFSVCCLPPRTMPGVPEPLHFLASSSLSYPRTISGSPESRSLRVPVTSGQVGDIAFLSTVSPHVLCSASYPLSWEWVGLANLQWAMPIRVKRLDEELLTC